MTRSQVVEKHCRSGGSRLRQKSGSRRRIGGSAVLGRVEVAGCSASGRTTFVNALVGHRFKPGGTPARRMRLKR